MKITLQKALFMVLPLAGLLFVNAPDVEARSRHHKHYKRDRQCHTDYKRDSHDRGWRHDYHGQRGRYGNRRPYYNNDRYSPSPYPYRPYYDRSYYDRSPYSGSPLWWAFDR